MQEKLNSRKITPQELRRFLDNTQRAMGVLDSKGELLGIKPLFGIDSQVTAPPQLSEEFRTNLSNAILPKTYGNSIPQALAAEYRLAERFHSQTARLRSYNKDLQAAVARRLEADAEALEDVKQNPNIPPYKVTEAMKNAAETEQILTGSHHKQRMTEPAFRIATKQATDAASKETDVKTTDLDRLAEAARLANQIKMVIASNSISFSSKNGVMYAVLNITDISATKEEVTQQSTALTDKFAEQMSSLTEKPVFDPNILSSFIYHLLEGYLAADTDEVRSNILNRQPAEIIDELAIILPWIQQIQEDSQTDINSIACLFSGKGTWKNNGNETGKVFEPELLQVTEVEPNLESNNLDLKEPEIKPSIPTTAEKSETYQFLLPDETIIKGQKARILSLLDAATLNKPISITELVNLTWPNNKNKRHSKDLSAVLARLKPVLERFDWSIKNVNPKPGNQNKSKTQYYIEKPSDLTITQTVEDITTLTELQVFKPEALEALELALLLDEKSSKDDIKAALDIENFRLSNGKRYGPPQAFFYFMKLIKKLYEDSRTQQPLSKKEQALVARYPSADEFINDLTTKLKQPKPTLKGQPAPKTETKQSTVAESTRPTNAVTSTTPLDKKPQLDARVIAKRVLENIREKLKTDAKNITAGQLGKILGISNKTLDDARIRRQGDTKGNYFVSIEEAVALMMNDMYHIPLKTARRFAKESLKLN